ncbi:endonuclease/exonuclease/phosphatase family protein [Pseudarthrobacter sp. S9]|uniref:endonuclease/exonuclease/phosphatase family protein n=1 Tax=Pseudarthrobacter sp. S9 TaxID=3418421 RepID=UPI003CFC2685
MTLPAPGCTAILRPQPARTVAWQVLASLSAAPVAALSFFRAVPAAWPTPVVQLLAFTPWLVLPAGLALVLAVPSRRVWAVVGTAALLAVQLYWLFPQDYGRGTPDPGARLAELKVMSINAELGNADAAEIVRLVRDNGIGLLTVQEHSQALEDRLAAEGLATLLPHRISHPVNGAAGSAVYSVHPMHLMGDLPDSQFQIPTVRIAMEAGGHTASLDVTNVHAQPPVDARTARWRGDLAALGGLTDSPGNLLLMGDFNATYDHSEFRQLLAGGAGNAGRSGGAAGRKMVDVGVAEGSRLVPTWPMDGLPLPGIVIDHIVTSPQVRSSAYAVHPVAGTDHAAIMATLAVPEAPASPAMLP